ncbi:MAG TPA: hypothetical protein VGD56_12885 [Gemmatirosa sp.]
MSTLSYGGPRGWAAVAGATVACATFAACGRDEPRPVARLATAAPVAAVAVPTGHVHSWDDAAGVGLVVRTPGGQEILVSPDTTDARTGAVRAAAGAADGGVVLFGRSGMLGHARADSTFDGAPLAGACATWSALRLGPSSGADVTPAWTVGFVVPAGAAQPAALALDSLDVLSSRDSATLAAAVTRLAAALPDTGVRGSRRRPALRGVPFRVRDAHRFTMADGSGAVVAILTRTLNTEATPFAEQLLLVAERHAARPYELTYAESVAGVEESLPAMDVLAAVQLPATAGATSGASALTPTSAVPSSAPHDSRAALVLGRDGDDGSRYTLLERESPGRWRVRWTSAVCRAGGAPRAS